MANTPLKVVVEVSAGDVQQAVDKYADALREEGRREVAQAVYAALEKHGPEADPGGSIGAALMASAGPTMMQDIIAERVVAEVQAQHQEEGDVEPGVQSLRACPECGGTDRLNNIIRTVGHPDEGQPCRHKWHREVDL